MTCNVLQGFKISIYMEVIMKRQIIFSLTIGVIAMTILTACSKQDDSQPIKGRWYTGDQLKLGKQVFADNCAACHGNNAESIPNGTDSSYSAPPLNGSAHAWHHSMSILIRTINEGGKELGGKMPGFKDKLSDAEKNAAIAYFQSYWDDRLYGIWKDNGNLKK